MAFAAPPGSAIVPHQESASNGKTWSARFPVYQIDFQAHASGKRIATTKRRVRWRFGFPNAEALNNGETGTSCRGEEHDVTIVWSLTSGKRLVLADGHEVHYSTNRANLFEFSWTMRGNHVLKVLAHAAPPLTATPGFRQYDFFVDGQSFFHMPKVYELGIKGPVGGEVRHPGVHVAPVASPQRPVVEYRNYDLNSGQYIPAPSTREEEEEDLQKAIQASLEESRSHLSPATEKRRSSLGALPSASTLDAGPKPPLLQHRSASVTDVSSVLEAEPASTAGEDRESLTALATAPESDLLDLLSEPSPSVPAITNGPIVSASSSFDPNSSNYGLGAPAVTSSASYPGNYGSAPPSYGGAPNYGAPPGPPGAPTQSYGAPPPGQHYGGGDVGGGFGGTLDPSSPPTFSQIENNTPSQFNSYGAPPPQPSYADPSKQGGSEQYGAAPQNGYGPPAGQFSSAPPPQAPPGDFQSTVDQTNQTGAPPDPNATTAPEHVGPKLSMGPNNPFGENNGEAEPEPATAVDGAMKKLVNIDDISAPVEEQMTKLTLNPFEDDPKKKKKEKKSRGIPPPAGTWAGPQPSLAEMQSLKAPNQQKVDVMNATSSFSPEAAQAGALVLHGTQQGNYGGYAQGPPPIQKQTGFGVGAHMGVSYGNYSAQPPQYGGQPPQQQQQYPPQQHMQQSYHPQQPPPQQGYGGPPPPQQQQYPPQYPPQY